MKIKNYFYKYKGWLRNKPLSTALSSVIVLFIIKTLFSVFINLFHSITIFYIISQLFESILFNLIYWFPMWFLIGAGLYEWGMRLAACEVSKTWKLRTVLYLILGILAIVVAKFYGIIPFFVLCLMAYISYKTGHEAVSKF